MKTRIFLNASSSIKYSYLLLLLMILAAGLLSFYILKEFDKHITEHDQLSATHFELFHSLARSEEQVYLMSFNAMTDSVGFHSGIYEEQIANEFLRQSEIIRQLSGITSTAAKIKLLRESELLISSYREEIYTILRKFREKKSGNQPEDFTGDLFSIYNKHKMASADIRKEYALQLAEMNRAEGKDLSRLYYWHLASGALLIILIVLFGNFLRKIYTGMRTQNRMLLNEIENREKIEERLISAKEAAEEANRLKTSFLANMSHELRTPMTGILGYSELLVLEAHTNELKEMALTVRDSAQRLMRTLNLILDLSRIDSGKLNITRTHADLVEMINAVCVKMDTMARKKSLYLRVRTDYESVYCETDQQMFTQIIENLINNAIKYTEVGGVEVEITSEDIAGGRRDAVIMVKDTGIGIDEKHLDLIWEDFRQASEGHDRSFEGTGLGLSITKKFVERLNGKIHVTSTPGVGSKFEIRFGVFVENLILRSPVRHALAEQRGDFTTGNGSKHNILYVEDDDGIATLVARCLASDYHVDHARNSQTALRLVKQNKYDIILMDINLGIASQDGITTTQMIRKLDSYKNTPVICITAFSMSGDREAFLAAGCTQYISKPFTNDQLIAELEKAAKTIRS
ncbi:MAG: Sensor histidine kinase RcsC [Ignavibacteriaceae bacterium]|nr:Sensor histidine kinase RcsC [Ignavibacteriaceae bacterium]